MGFSWSGALAGAGAGSAFGPWGTAIGAGLGGFMGGGSEAQSAYQEAQSTNDLNIAFNRENRAWLEMMSNTAHQREVKDLIAAGLNPILSANSAGAHVPGAMPPVIENPRKNFASDRALIGNMMTNTAKSISEMGLNKIMGNKTKIDADISKQTLRTAKAQAQMAEQDAQQYTSPWGKAMNWVKLTLNSGLGGFVGGGGLLATALRMGGNSKSYKTGYADGYFRRPK